MRRWIMVLISLAIHKSYAADAPCEPKSKMMQMVKSCYSGDMSSVDGTGRFTSSIDSTGNGVNYCYNALAFLRRDGGRTKIEVLQDNKFGELRVTTFGFDSKSVYTADKNVVVLKGLEAKCFAYQAKNDHCGGLFGNSDIPMAMTLGVSGDGYKLENFTNDRNLIKEAKGRAALDSGDLDHAKTAMKVLIDIRQRLLAKSKQLLANKPDPKRPVTGFKDFRWCMNQFNEWIATNHQSDKMKLPYAFTKEDDALLGKVGAMYNMKNTPLEGQAPGSAR